MNALIKRHRTHTSNETRNVKTIRSKNTGTMEGQQNSFKTYYSFYSIAFSVLCIKISNNLIQNCVQNKK